MGPVIANQPNTQELVSCEKRETKTEDVQHTPAKPSTKSALAGCLPRPKCSQRALLTSSNSELRDKLLLPMDCLPEFSRSATHPWTSTKLGLQHRNNPPLHQLLGQRGKTVKPFLE